MQRTSLPHERSVAERLSIVESLRAKALAAAEDCNGVSLTHALKDLSEIGVQLEAEEAAWAVEVFRDVATESNSADLFLAALALPETPEICRFLLHLSSRLEPADNAWFRFKSWRSIAREHLLVDDSRDLWQRKFQWEKLAQLTPLQADARSTLAPWVRIANCSTAYRHHLRTRGLVPTNEDRRLSFKWVKNEVKDDEWELARCLSARLAERAVGGVYQRLGHEVIDVSIDQLGPNDERWRMCDILVNGKPVDVKNARSALHRESYVDHCVPSFKKWRDAEVRIAGVLSDYVKPADLLRRTSDTPHSETLFLGETSLSRQRDLREWFEISDILTLNYGNSQPTTNSVIPPWMFEYPADVYTARDAARRDLLKRPFPIDAFNEVGIEALPYAITIGHPIAAELAATHDEQSRIFVLQLTEAIARFGLSLPAVYLAILRHWVESLRLPRERRLSPSCYRNLILLQGTTRPALPLGILDPLRTVPELIKCLEHLHSQSELDLSRYDNFKLTGVGILQAKPTGTARSHTLVAYCGGWRPNRGKCSHYPLVIGQESSCPRCFRLVCSKCNYCSKECAPQSGNTRRSAPPNW